MGKTFYSEKISTSLPEQPSHTSGLTGVSTEIRENTSAKAKNMTYLITNLFLDIFQ